MTAIEVLVLDGEFWSLSLFSKHSNPVQLYAWVKRRSTKRLEAIVVERQLEKKPPVDTINSPGKLRRSISLPGRLDELSTETSMWYKVRVLGKKKSDTNMPEAGKLVTSTKLFRPSEFLPWVHADADQTADHAAFEGAYGPGRKICKAKDPSDPYYSHMNPIERRDLNDYLESQRDLDQKQEQAKQDFKTFIRENTTENLSFETMRRIAVKNQLLSGHWTFYGGNEVEKEDRDDSTWQRLLYSFFFGPLSREPVNQLHFKRTPDGRSMAVTNTNCQAIERNLERDEMDQEVAMVEKAVRLSCIRYGRMKYKADVFSACQITHANQKKVRPTIYKSEHNREKFQSQIRTDYTTGYEPTVTFGQEAGGQETVWFNKNVLEERLPIALRMPNFLRPAAFFRRPIPVFNRL